MGGFLVVGGIAFIYLMQTTGEISVSFWLSKWSGTVAEKGGENIDNNYYLRIYFFMAMFVCAAVMARAFSEALALLNAAKNFHNSLLKAGSPFFISFFFFWRFSLLTSSSVG
jgi:hypothetical protein